MPSGCLTGAVLQFASSTPIPEVETMHDALDIHTAPQRRSDSPAAARARRPGARRRFQREAFDDWDSSRHRGFAPA